MAIANVKKCPMLQTYVLVTDGFLAVTGLEYGDVEELNGRLGSKIHNFHCIILCSIAIKIVHILKVSGFNCVHLRIKSWALCLFSPWKVSTKICNITQRFTGCLSTKSFYDLRNEFIAFSEAKEQDVAEIRNIKWVQNLVSSEYIMRHLYGLNIFKEKAD
jgi:hypothetical protein